MKKLAPAICLVALTVVGCGGGGDSTTDVASESDDFTLMLDFFPNADHAGIYAAEAGGHFAEEGLDVVIRQPSDPAAPIRQVAAGRVDLAVSYEPEVLRARDAGEPVVSVAAVVQRPLTSIISLPDAGIDEPADLEGATVATAGIDYQSAFLDAILEEAGVPRASVTERNVGFNLSQALIGEAADASLGAFWNYEGTDLKLRGEDPRIIKLDEAGIPSYDELVLVANEEALAEDPEPIEHFLAALARGTGDLERDPDAAIEGLLEANPDLDPELQRKVVAVTLPLFFPAGEEPYGFQDPAERREFARFMVDAGLIESAPEGAYTNEHLPQLGRRLR